MVLRWKTGIERIIKLTSLVLTLMAPSLYAHVSVAHHTSDPSTLYSSGTQPNRVVAAQSALRKCQRTPIEQQANGVCELISMDSMPIATAQQLLPQNDTTPLYLWRFQNGDATVYLAGTVHILKASLYPLPRQYEDAYHAAENLVFEVDLSRYPPADVQQKTLKYARLSEQTLRQSLPEDTYHRLVQAGLRYGMPVGQMQAFKPMLAFQQLGVLGLTAMGYDPAFGIDHYLGQLGQRQPEHILQLESLELQLSLLFNQPLDVQVAVLEQALDELDDLQATTSELVKAYFNGDDDALGALLKRQAGEHPLTKAFNQQLIEQRNRAMTKKVRGYLQTPNSYLVLVGAAHLIGPQGIVALLSQAGFTGVRIHSDQTIHESRH